MKDSAGRVISGPRLTHGDSYAGPLNPNLTPPVGKKKVAKSLAKGFGLLRRKRTVMVFAGERLSSREALERFPNLIKRLDGGKGLKERSLQAKLLGYYKKGDMLGKDLRTYKARLDPSRSLPNGIVSKYESEQYLEF